MNSASDLLAVALNVLIIASDLFVGRCIILFSRLLHIFMSGVVVLELQDWQTFVNHLLDPILLVLRVHVPCARFALLLSR